MLILAANGTEKRYNCALSPLAEDLYRPFTLHPVDVSFREQQPEVETFLRLRFLVAGLLPASVGSVRLGAGRTTHKRFRDKYSVKCLAPEILWLITKRK